MTEFTLEELTRLYAAYVDGYREASGELPSMMELKRVHTMNVVENARLIAEGERFSEDERECSLAAALLHDTGRYEQLKRYNTFRDSESVDHAVFSHDIVKERGWVSEPAILNAVLWHNRRDLPEKMERLEEIAAHTVRDADKLDIFRVLEDRVANSDWRNDSRAFWNLATDRPPNPEVVECIENRLPVDYQNIKSLSDFVLIQVGWMISGLHFKTARHLCRERKHLAYRREFLHQLTDDKSIDRLCDMAEGYLV